MVQVIGQGRVKSPSASQRLGMAFSNAAGGISEHLLNQKNLQMENEAAKSLGINLEGFGPEMRQKILADELLGRRERSNREFDAFTQGQRDRQQFLNQMELQQNKFDLDSGLKADKQRQDLREKVVPFQNALSAINEMRQIRKKGNLGILSPLTGLWSHETLRDKGKYETLGNSLIQFSSNIPIRNRQEFEKLAGHLSDPHITDARASGILDALESIIKGNMSQYEMEGDQEFMPSQSSSSKKPPLTSFLRK